MEATDLRLPPQNLDAERCVLGSCMVLNEAIDEAAEILRASQFYHEKHAIVWSAIAGLRDKRKPVDAVSLAEELERRKQLNEAGGVRYLMELMDTVPHAAHVRHYAEIVRDKWQRRELLKACTDAVRECYNGSVETADLVSQTQASVLAVDAESDRREPAAIGSMLVEAFANLGNPERTRTMSTTFERLDQLCGFPIGGLTIIGARPSIGKTALMLSIAGRLGEAGVPVLVSSYEQQRLEIAERFASIFSGVSFYRMTKGLTTQSENERIVQAGSWIDQTKIYIDDSCRPQGRLMAMIRGMWRRRGIRAVFIDYLQLVPPDDTRSNREQQIASMSRAFKLLASELKIPIVVLSQINRQSDIQEREPRASDLRESGAIEQDADLVLMLHRPNVGRTEDDRPDDFAIVKIEKQRNGPRGRVALDWVSESMAYRNISDSSRAVALAEVRGGRPVKTTENF